MSKIVTLLDMLAMINVQCSKHTNTLWSFICEYWPSQWLFFILWVEKGSEVTTFLGLHNIFIVLSKEALIQWFFLFQESEENQITLAFCKAFYLFSMLVDFWESRKFSMWAKKCITNKYNDALQNIKFNKLYDKKIMIK